jgi:uncharacterized protein YjiS (DUF1127 family)
MIMTITDRIENFNPAALARLPLLSRLAFDLAFTIAKWQMRSATRKSLQKLNGHLLYDIGLEPGEAHSECTKRFWQE